MPFLKVLSISPIRVLVYYCTTEDIKVEFNITSSHADLTPKIKRQKKKLTVFFYLLCKMEIYIHYIRQGHVVAWLKGYFNDCGALDVDLPASGGVAPSHPTSLVKPMGLDSSHIITHKHLQNH